MLITLVLGTALTLNYVLTQRVWEHWTKEPLASGPLEQLEPGDVDFAVRALQSNELVRQISQGQAFRVGRTTASRMGSKKIGVWIEILWDQPAAADGPWTNIECRGTRIETGTLRVHDLLGLTAIVSLTDGKLLALWPGAQQPHTRPDGSLNWGYVADDDHFQHALPDRACPAGLNDD